MALDVLKWLKEDMKFSDEKAAALAAEFQADGRADLLEKGYLRQSDYSKKLDKLSADQTALQAANEALTEEMANWATARANGETQTKAQIKAREDAEAEVLRLRQAVERKATELGFDPKAVLEGAVVVPQNPPDNKNNPPIDTSKFVTVDAFSQLANAAIYAPAEIAVIQHEHHQLTGEWLDPTTLVNELKTRAQTKGNQKSLDLRTIWEEQHDIPAKRESKQKSEYDAAIAAAEERGRLAARTEQALPGHMPQGRTAVVFRGQGEQPRQSVLKRDQPGTTASKAAAALATGKYRNQGAPRPGASAGT